MWVRQLAPPPRLKCQAWWLGSRFPVLLKQKLEDPWKRLPASLFYLVNSRPLMSWSHNTEWTAPEEQHWSSPLVSIRTQSCNSQDLTTHTYLHTFTLNSYTFTSITNGNAQRTYCVLNYIYLFKDAASISHSHALAIIINSTVRIIVITSKSLSLISL